MERLTVTGIIRQRAESTPDKIAIIVNDQRLNYRQLYKSISAAAAYLHKKGVKRGSHVVSVASPSFEYVISMYAALGIGAVQIPVENHIPIDRLSEIAKAVDADFVISEKEPDYNCVWISPREIDDTSDVPDLEPVGISDECSEIVFTTGTTGKSKGVMLTSHCLEVYLTAMNPSFRLDETSVFLVTTPLHHVGGMHRIHQCMAAGSTVILMDGVRDLRAFFGAIHAYGVTHTYLPPASVKLLITLARKELARLDGKLQFIYTASAPFPVKDIETLMSLLPHTHLHQGYGSSETGSICNCCYNAPGESADCLGKPYPCVEVVLADADGKIITEPYKEGFIRSRSGMNMIGYYKEPELTAKVLKDGFIYSSDLMFFDEKGNLHFAGRGDDVINVRGFKVSPTEVENLVLKHPSVADCVCIPYEDPQQGCVIKLLVRLNEGYALDMEDITVFLSEGLEPYKVPKFIEQVDEILRTPNGKVDRKAIIKQYSNQGIQ